MAVDSQFWIKAWNEGRTAFHQEEYHEKLIEYFPQLKPSEGQRVLVPLCGKSKDLLCLHELKLRVHGIELHEKAVESFFTENKLSPVTKERDQDFIHYTYKNIVISSGDFFKLNETNSYDLVYDRAALVALPSDLRKKYTKVLKQLLKPGGKYLLIAYEYDQTKMEGPPFSVEESEVRKLYGDQFKIKLLERERPGNEGARLLAVESLTQTVYLMVRK